MFKKLKSWISLQIRIQIEVLEMLCTVFLYPNVQGHYKGNPYAEYMPEHFMSLKDFSEELGRIRNENH